MLDTVVFLGPSLPADRARQILEADYRPPARRGDIYQAAEAGAKVICLIDGVFFQDCSVAHKEVLYALGRGCRVLGASSMGARRAAELDVSKGQLASLLGTIPETLSRILTKMNRRGLIRSRGAQIRIIDRRGLEEIALEGKKLP